MKERSRQLLRQVVELDTAREEAELQAELKRKRYDEGVRELMAWCDDEGFEDFGYANLVCVGNDVYVVRIDEMEGTVLDISACTGLDDETRRALISLLEGESSEELADYVEGEL